MDINEAFKRVLIEIFGMTEEKAREYVADDEKWIGEEEIELPNDYCLSFINNTFTLWTTVVCEDDLIEIIEKELSIDVKNNKVAETMIDILMRRAASEINNKTKFNAYIDSGFLHVEKNIKSIKGIKETIEKEVPVIERIRKKLETYKCLYEFLTPSEIQRLLLSKVTYVAPVQIKKIGGSYGVIIPIDVLKMFVNEEVLKKGSEITAKLRANANSGEIIISDFEF